MLSRNDRGQVIRVFSYSNPMRKHGGDHQMFCDRGIAALNSVTTTTGKVTPCNARGFILRRKVA